jgi:hypothetical protein
MCIVQAAQIGLYSLHHYYSPVLADGRVKMENPKEDMPCNCGMLSNNFLIKYEKNQIALKTIVCDDEEN